MTARPEISVVIPMFNEEENIEAVVPPLASTLRDAGLQFEIVIVDNGSRDTTAERAAKLADGDPNIKVVTVAENEGYGHGILRGFRASQGTRVAYMAGDGQIRPADALRIFQTAVSRGLPFVKAKRYIRQDGPTRYLASLAFNALLRLRFGVKTWDANGTPKVMDAEILRRLQLSSKDFFIDAELTIKLKRLGIQPFEVPVVFYPRAKGKSTVGWPTILALFRSICAPRIDARS